MATNPIRQFDSGANRDTAEGKLAFEGFLHPLVLLRFGEYMHKHRRLPNGELRDADNWQKGMPVDVYMDSLLRHVMDVWLWHRGHEAEAREDVMEALCASLFNIQGMMLELLREDHDHEK